MYYKFLKLVNGDNLIVTTDDQCSTLKDKEYLSVVDPVLISSMRFPRGTMVVETYVMQPWIKMAKSDVFQIPINNIVIATDVHEMAEEQYKKYIAENDSNSLQEQEGGPSSAIEDLMQRLLGSADTDDYDEEEDDDEFEQGDTSDGRTLH